MQETIRKEPEKFIAYNNGLTITATESALEQKEGIYYINTLTDFQIVNGGQTTASLYFAKKKDSEIDLRLVRVPAKIIILKSQIDFIFELLRALTRGEMIG